MRNDLTDITLVVDRSGSMMQIKSDAEGGVNAFIADQAEQPGEALLTLVEFDTQYEFVHKGAPIGEVGPYQLQPRGMTALLDAVGRAINETGQRLSTMNEEDRPGLVVFVVMTDGLENSSREFSKSQIRRMIEHQQTAFNWQFTFLGANQDAFAEAHGLGINKSGAASFAPHKVAAAYQATGEKVKRMRSAALHSRPIDNSYTDDERKQMGD